MTMRVLLPYQVSESDFAEAFVILLLADVVLNDLVKRLGNGAEVRVGAEFGRHGVRAPTK